MTQFSKKENKEEKIEEYVILDDKEMGFKENWKEKILDFLDGKYFISIIIILVAIIAFSLGRISGIQERRPPVRVISESIIGEVKGVSTDNPINTPYLEKENEKNNSVSVPSDSSGQVVASKNGTRYHYPWCGGAKQISSKNLITFNSIEDARAAGYTPAANCKGLK